jgi:hypothetical protein
MANRSECIFTIKSDHVEPELREGRICTAKRDEECPDCCLLAADEFFSKGTDKEITEQNKIWGKMEDDFRVVLVQAWLLIMFAESLAKDKFSIDFTITIRQSE